MKPNIVHVGPLNHPIDESLLSLPNSQQPTNGLVGMAVPAYLSVGTLYSFKNIGDQIEPHTHTDANNHYTAILLGQISYNTYERNELATTTTLNQGSFMLVPPNVRHQFVSKVANSVCLNLQASAFNEKTIQLTIDKNVNALQSVLTLLQSIQKT